VNAEQRRLLEARKGTAAWKKWGPYLSERQWGTVREDDSLTGNAWEAFPHDEARSRIYKYGEDGLAGFCDERQRLCFALALWNGRDAILKERLFGLTNGEGNHGEDVKEYYFYLDATPTNSYLKYLYKYPQAAFPYEDLVNTNRSRTRGELEYELLDTGVFDDDRYFDVFVEYAKAAPDDILIYLRIENRGPEDAGLHVLPTLWFRNTWWAGERLLPSLYQSSANPDITTIAAFDTELGHIFLHCEGAVPLLFTENETNFARLRGHANPTAFTKDGINDAVVRGELRAVNSEHTGTKAAAHYQLTIKAHDSAIIRLRMCAAEDCERFEYHFADVLTQRRREADEFWNDLCPRGLSPDQRRVVRQALAGMLWSKQYYEFDLASWLAQHGADPVRQLSAPVLRNQQWFHMRNRDIISMPDKWEYPWYAAWDLAFHVLPLSIVDLDFAKQQLALMLIERYIHPNGQIPAYEWNFSDVNPPVHAWAAYWIYTKEKAQRGRGDLDFLAGIFRRLLMNFTWWVNRKDPEGRNIFGGGFLGLDNIGVFDRSAPMPMGGHLEQADGTAWMAFFCLTMLQIATELAREDRSHESEITKFVEHFLWIAAAMDRVGDHADEMWDEEDGFYYDVLKLPDGHAQRLQVRSLVGLLPLCAVAVVPQETLERFPECVRRVHEFIARYPHLAANIAPLSRAGVGGRRLFCLLNEGKLRRVLAKMLDENEFLGPYGIRALSRYHLERPYSINIGGQEYRVQYEPAESSSNLFGGNSNWRGPVWYPINALILRALVLLYTYYGNDFTIECPTGSGRHMTLLEIAREIERRLSSIFLLDEEGRRPVFGAAKKFQTDPHWRDYLLFYEYFHGDNGAGIGASHQTGWTGLVGPLTRGFAAIDAEELLELGATSLARPIKSAT
jgi:hypothetical protein